jgi:propanol-preferring alcohol dehydrogenase
VANSTQQDVVELLEFASRIPIHIEAQTFRLEKANEALQLLKAGRIDGAGVLEVA